MTQESLQRFLAFYRGKSPDAEGRYIDEIWQWHHHHLETTHNYIQWLFPLIETSGFNRRAPILTADGIAIFRGSEDLRSRLLTSLKVMLAFYGLQIGGEAAAGVEIRQSADYADRKANWVRPQNHNHLRLTRILKSLRLLGLEEYAQALFICLEQIHQEESGNIAEETLAHWRQAITGKAGE